MDLGISFSHPENGYLLILAGVVVAFMVNSARVRAKIRVLLKLNDSDTSFDAPVNRGLKNILYLVGLVATGLAAMGPQWGQKMHPIKAQGLDICFALDLSRSMLTEDVAPNRLGQAKNELDIFLPRLGGDRAALVGFAGSAYVSAPLSVDHEALSTFLTPMTPDIVTDQATNLSAGVETCLSALGLDEIKERNQLLDDAAKLVVLITDGEDTESEDTGALARAVKLGVPIFSIAVGTAKGGPIAIRDNGQLKEYLKDPSTGQPVLSKLEDKELKRLADKTGGKVFYASQGIEAWTSFENAISDYKRASRDAGTKLDKEDRFQWPLLVAVLVLLFDFVLTETKWRWKLGVLILFLIPLGAPRAASNQDPGVVWFNNGGVGAFKSKDYKKADEDFLRALTDDAADPQAKYNWAANKLHSAEDKENPGKYDPKTVDEAVGELEKLRQDPRVQNSPLRDKVDYQLGQAYEMKNETPKALESYYKVLSDADADKNLQAKTKDNVSRLIIADEQNQNQKQSSGGGGGSQDPQKQPQDQNKDKDKDKKGGDKPDQPPPPPKYGQEKQKPKFNGNDLNEQQAKQIMESVSGQEKEVLKRKAKTEANEQRIKKSRDAREHGEASRAKAW